MTYTVISIFFILLLAYLVLRAVYGFIRRDRKERIVFLREFKKGKCVAVYLIAIPLFFIGYDYVQESGTYAIFETISRTFNSVVNMIALKFEFMSVETLMKDNHVYGAAVISCNIICLFNTFVFVASLAQQFFWESSCLTRFNRKADAKYIIVGDNPGTRRIYKSIKKGRKLLAKVKDWDIKDTKIFAYQRHKDEGRMQSGIIAFGNENKNLYNMSELDDSMLVSFSINRNRIYALERARKYGSAESEEKIVKAADRSWFAEWPQAKRDSNLYASLSVRSKLLMMGLDFEKKKGGKSYLSYNEYMKLYAGDDLPETTGTVKNGRGSAIRFSTNFKPSRAYNMAYQEHQRWNAYMMSRGIVPADKETILNETDDSGRHTNGNSYERRHHGNLTNFDGLRGFAKMIAKRDNISEEKADVILYDYQLLDDAWWILDEMGYGIYEIA